MTTKRINAATGGRRCSFRIDQLADIHLLWSARVGNEFLQQKTSPSTIVRRALEFYSQHLELLIEAPSGDTRITAERVLIRKANQDKDTVITEEDVLTGSLCSLHQIRQAKNSLKPKLADTLKADLVKWASPK
jgi:hypothetical protein